MKLKYGSTRCVFVFKDFVIKFPRLRVYLFFVRLFKHTKEKNVVNKIKQHRIGIAYLFNFFTQGVKANFREYRYSKKHPKDPEIIPVQGLFYGLILIQPRGQEFLESRRKWKRRLKRLKKLGVTDPDMLVSHNYSLWFEKLRLHDYGNQLTVDQLSQFS